MLDRPVIAALNHVLEGDAWARERLRLFAGQHVRVVAGPLRLALTVAGDGLFASEEVGSEPAVVITLPGDAPFRYLLDPALVFATAKLAGSAEFAETLAFVFRNLRWDAEGDLAKVVGDIAAHRLARLGQATVAWQKQAIGNAVNNFAEYVSEEDVLIAPRREVELFCRTVDLLRDDLARLEKRLAKL